MTRSLLFTVALIAGVVDAAGAPEAQPPPRSSAQRQADQHFKSGVARFKEQKYTEALAEFERAYEISPHPLVLYNIAGCYRELSRYGEAVKFYRRFLAEGVGKAPATRLADAQKELDGIFALVARVTVKVEPESGASLLLDGELLGALPLEMPLILAPGEHRIVARAPGRADAERVVRVASGNESLVELTLAAPAGEPPPLRPTPTGPTVGTRPGPDTTIREPGPTPPVRRAAKRFAVNAAFATNLLRVAEADTGTASLGLGLALGSRLELGVDATLVAYSVIPSLRLRIVGDTVSLHAIVAVPISFNDGDEMKTFATAAAGLGIRLRIPALPSLALRLESYASYGGEARGTAVPTFLGGELWF